MMQMGDSLPDWFEDLYDGISVTNMDTDNDDISDALEDLDDDGLNNRYEFLSGTDPTKADTDGNGTADGSEILLLGDVDNLTKQKFGLLPRTLNTDDDGPVAGLNDIDEITNGSNPGSSSSPQEFGALSITDAGQYIQIF